MTRDCLTIMLPPEILHPNARPHPLAKADAVRGYRLNVAALTISWTKNRRPRFKRLRIAPTFYFTRHRRRDRDNLIAWLKAAVDGLVDGGLLADDAGLDWTNPVVGIDKANPRVELRFFEPVDENGETEADRRMGVANARLAFLGTG